MRQCLVSYLVQHVVQLSLLTYSRYIALHEFLTINIFLPYSKSNSDLPSRILKNNCHNGPIKIQCGLQLSDIK